jgi:hypothetical protein
MASDQEIPQSEKPGVELHRLSEVRKEKEEKVKSFEPRSGDHLSRKCRAASIISPVATRVTGYLPTPILGGIRVRVFQ